MSPKNILSCLLALVLGAIAGAVIKVGYTLPGVLPTSDLYTYIVNSPLGLVALKATSGKAGLMIAVVMRAFPWSVAVGAIAGLILHKITYQRVFCYSALWLPIANAVLGYISLSEISTSHPEYFPAIKQAFGDLLWVNSSVYGWYFLALYLFFAISRRFVPKNPVSDIRNMGVTELPQEVSIELRSQVERIWKWSGCYFFPLHPTQRSDVLAFDETKLKKIFPEIALSNLIAAIAENNVTIWRECDPAISVVAASYEFGYGCSEQFAVDESKNWIVYWSHEGTITFGGDELLSRLKNAVPNWASALCTWSGIA